MASSVVYGQWGVYSIPDGKYTKAKILGSWGKSHGIPERCCEPVVSRGGVLCEVCPSWFINGKWTCGKHRAKGCIPPLPPPPPPPSPPSFIPFECSICINDCTERNKEYTTPCGHKFHKKCMKKWAIQKRIGLNCPLCRTNIPNPHPFVRYQLDPTSSSVQQQNRMSSLTTTERLRVERMEEMELLRELSQTAMMSGADSALQQHRPAIARMLHRINVRVATMEQDGVFAAAGVL